MEFVALFANISVLSIIIFIAGIVLVVAEMFIPGFGICGTLGVALLIIDIFITAKTITQGLILTAMCLAILAVIFGIFISLASRGKLPNRLILKESTSAESGFSGAEDLQYLLGKSGVAVTACRPAGNVDFEGVKLDVVSGGEYIEKGTAVKVIEVEGNKIVVKTK